MFGMMKHGCDRFNNGFGGGKRDRYFGIESAQSK
jgi:hypothetical protein